MSQEGLASLPTVLLLTPAVYDLMYLGNNPHDSDKFEVTISKSGTLVRIEMILPV